MKKEYISQEAISIKNSKANSAFPGGNGIFAIYSREYNELIGTLQRGESYTSRRTPGQGGNYWDIFVPTLKIGYDSVSREEALLWNKEISINCILGKRCGKEFPLIILDQQREVVDFYLKPLVLQDQDNEVLVVNKLWWFITKEMFWWNGFKPDFGWANIFNEKNIEHLLSNTIKIPKKITPAEFIQFMGEPQNVEYDSEKDRLRIKEETPKIQILGHVDINPEEGEQRPRRGAKAARKPSSEEEVPIAE